MIEAVGDMSSMAMIINPPCTARAINGGGWRVATSIVSHMLTGSRVTLCGISKGAVDRSVCKELMINIFSRGRHMKSVSVNGCGE